SGRARCAPRRRGATLPGRSAHPGVEERGTTPALATGHGRKCGSSVMKKLLGAALAIRLTAAVKAQVSQDVDAAIAPAGETVPTGNVRADDEMLVSFGTRSTLSAQDPESIAAGHGIGAAREWLEAQLEAYSKECGGCLEVKTDAFV